MKTAIKSNKIRFSDSLKIRFVVIFSLFIFISLFIICLQASLSILKTGEAFATERGFPICTKTVNYIDADAFERLAVSQDTSDPFYETTRLWMLNLKNTVGCKYLYTMAPIDGTLCKYVIDGSCDPSDEENFSPIGTEEDLSTWGSATQEVIMNGGRATSGLEKQENWGWTISTYEAIKNSSGKIVGFVGCDFDIGFLVETIRHQIIKIIIVGFIFIIIGSFLIWIFVNMIFGAMSNISIAMEQIANGARDLTARIPVKGSNELSLLAKNCNSVIKNLEMLVAKLKDETSILSETGNQLYNRMSNHIQQISAAATGISDIDERVSKQNGKLETITSGVRNVEKEITGLDALITEQSEAVLQSSAAIEQISANIQSVNRSVELIMEEYSQLVSESGNGRQMQENVSEQIEQIAQQSENLNEANTAITDIAAKTNMLAMNAAIEAAHAGEFGKGFGVVADEIRVLAETSATQSTAIRELLAGIASAISGIVESSKYSAAAFDSVGNKITQIDSLIREVQNGMQEESTGVGNILDTMKTLDNTTRDITNASSHMKSESSDVFHEIEELQQITSETLKKSTIVASTMTEMQNAAETAMTASDRNRDAAKNVFNMIDVFKVSS